MPRCVTTSSTSPVSRLAALTLAGALAALAPLFAAAQAHRNFPATALRGKLEFVSPPDVKLNGHSARLAPGMRIHGPDNMLVMSGAVVGQKFVVDYTLESTGLVYEIWLLTPAEASVSPWPTTPAQAAAWSFDWNAQTWTKP